MGYYDKGDEFEVDGDFDRDNRSKSRPPRRGPRPRRENYHDTAPLASLGQRLMAHIADTIIYFVAIMPGFAMIIISIIQAEKRRNNEPDPVFMLGGFLVLVLLFFGVLAYNYYLLSLEGQTLGKKMIGIRVVNYHDGDNPGFVQAVLLRSFVTFLLANFIPFFSMIDACFIFGDERRCVHDLIANTTVIAD